MTVNGKERRGKERKGKERKRKQKKNKNVVLKEMLWFQRNQVIKRSADDLQTVHYGLE